MIEATWKVSGRGPEHTVDETSCEWNGKTYSAKSFAGSGHALCRVLKEAGCPDQPMVVRDQNGKALYSFESIHSSAEWTYHKQGHLVRFKARSGGDGAPAG